jgi:hypothetical protein
VAVAKINRVNYTTM